LLIALSRFVDSLLRGTKLNARPPKISASDPPSTEVAGQTVKRHHHAAIDGDDRRARSILEQLGFVSERPATQAEGRPVVLAGLVMPYGFSLVSGSLVSGSVAVMRVCLVAVFGSLSCIGASS
jgi:hypothetical protein